jgi:TRAP-type mannitol/chloroaromatic compound transport system permease large subunit
MNEVMIGLIGLAGVLVLFLTGIELGFAMALVGFLGFSYIVSFKAGLNLLAKDIFDVFASYGFTVIPLFVLMGQIAFNAGIAKRLYNTAYRFIGHVPGGMAMATVAGATAFKAICGSSPATAATFASVAVPEMDRQETIHRNCRHCGDSWNPYPAECHTDCIWYYYRAVHRQTISGRTHSGINHRLLFYLHHLRMV